MHNKRFSKIFKNNVKKNRGQKAMEWFRFLAISITTPFVNQKEATKAHSVRATKTVIHVRISFDCRTKREHNRVYLIIDQKA